MATLIVDRLRCLEEHDFFGTDDVYVVYFIGRNPPSASSLHVKGPGSAWGDISTGDVREANVTLDSSYNPENFYMVALIEKDAGKDIAGEQEENVEGWMKSAYASLWASGSIPKSELAGKMKTQMIVALAHNFNGDDDTLLGVRWLKPLTNSGQWRALNYYGDSSHYRIKFLRQ
jgi:hypothetical protein